MKAQLQVTETIFIVIIIILIIAFSLQFLAKTEEIDFMETQKTFKELDDITFSQLTSALTEVQCSHLDVRSLSCMDKVKMESFIELLSRNRDLTAEYYFSQLKNAKIEVVTVYCEACTPADIPAPYVLYENTIDGSYETETFTMPVNIYDSFTEEYNFGYLLLERYTAI